MKKDLSASVRQKLANIAKANGMFFQEILQRHVDGKPKAVGEVIKLLIWYKTGCILPDS